MIARETIEEMEELKRMQQALPSEEKIMRLSDFFSVFGDSTRMRIIAALRSQELCVGDLAILLGLSISAVSHQLKLLRQKDLVRTRRQGKYVFYGLSDEHVTTIFDMGLCHLEEK